MQEVGQLRVSVWDVRLLVLDGLEHLAEGTETTIDLFAFFEAVPDHAALLAILAASEIDQCEYTSAAISFSWLLSRHVGRERLRGRHNLLA